MGQRGPPVILKVVSAVIEGKPDSGTGSIKKEASQTRDLCVAKNATRRAARPDPSLRKNRLLGMTIEYIGKPWPHSLMLLT
jgi:hypothetical protein